MKKLFIIPLFLISLSAFAHPISGVVDGDTLRTNVEIIPYIVDSYKSGTPNIRIDGIDTPEKGAGAKYDKEKNLALKATDFIYDNRKSTSKLTLKVSNIK